MRGAATCSERRGDKAPMLTCRGGELVRRTFWFVWQWLTNMQLHWLCTCQSLQRQRRHPIHRLHCAFQVAWSHPSPAIQSSCSTENYGGSSLAAGSDTLSKTSMMCVHFAYWPTCYSQLDCFVSYRYQKSEIHLPKAIHKYIPSFQER